MAASSAAADALPGDDWRVLRVADERGTYLGFVDVPQDLTLAGLRTRLPTAVPILDTNFVFLDTAGPIPANREPLITVQNFVPCVRVRKVAAPPVAASLVKVVVRLEDNSRFETWIAPGYTFEQLRVDACRSRGLDATDYVLQDADGCAWPGAGIVQEAINGSTTPLAILLTQVALTTAAMDIHTPRPHDPRSTQEQAIGVLEIEEELWRIFTYYCVSGDTLDVRYMRSRQWTRFLGDCKLLRKPGPQPSRFTIFPSHADILYASEAKGGVGGKGKLAYEEFLNVLMAIARLAEGDNAEVTAEDCVDAFVELLADHVLPHASRWPAQQWLSDREKIHTTSMKVLVDRFRDALHDMFRFYTVVGDQPPSLQYGDFHRFVHDVGLTQLHFSNKQLAEVYLSACSSGGLFPAPVTGIDLSVSAAATNHAPTMSLALGDNRSIDSADSIPHLATRLVHRSLAKRVDSRQDMAPDAASHVSLSTFARKHGDADAIPPPAARTAMTFAQLLEALCRLSLSIGLGNGAMTPELGFKALLQSMTRHLKRARILDIIARRRETCAYPGGLMSGSMRLNARFVEMWKEDGQLDYLGYAHQRLRAPRIKASISAGGTCPPDAITLKDILSTGQAALQQSVLNASAVTDESPQLAASFMASRRRQSVAVHSPPGSLNSSLRSDRRSVTGTPTWRVSPITVRPDALPPASSRQSSGTLQFGSTTPAPASGYIASSVPSQRLNVTTGPAVTGSPPRETVGPGAGAGRAALQRLVARGLQPSQGWANGASLPASPARFPLATVATDDDEYDAETVSLGLADVYEPWAGSSQSVAPTVSTLSPQEPVHYAGRAIRTSSMSSGRTPRRGVSWSTTDFDTVSECSPDKTEFGSDAPFVQSPAPRDVDDEGALETKDLDLLVHASIGVNGFAHSDYTASAAVHAVSTTASSHAAHSHPQLTLPPTLTSPAGGSSHSLSAISGTMVTAVVNSPHVQMSPARSTVVAAPAFAPVPAPVPAVMHTPGPVPAPAPAVPTVVVPSPRIARSAGFSTPASVVVAATPASTEPAATSTATFKSPTRSLLPPPIPSVPSMTSAFIEPESASITSAAKPAAVGHEPLAKRETFDTHDSRDTSPVSMEEFTPSVVDQSPALSLPPRPIFGARSHSPSTVDTRSDPRRTELRAIRKLLTDGSTFIKHGRRGNPHVRVVRMDEQMRNICWYEGNSDAIPSSASRMPITEITAIEAGSSTSVFKRAAKPVKDSLCFSVIGKSRTLDLQASSDEHRDLWVYALRSLLAN